jgi:lipopolysaccharide biosynthesis regulator YciM
MELNDLIAAVADSPNKLAAVSAAMLVSDIALLADKYDAVLQGLITLEAVGQDNTDFFAEGEEILAEIYDEYDEYLEYSNALDSLLSSALNLTETDRKWRHHRLAQREAAAEAAQA